MPGKYNDYRNQFQRENYDRLNVPVAKGTVAALKECAKQKGYDGYSDYIRALILADSGIDTTRKKEQ